MATVPQSTVNYIIYVANSNLGKVIYIKYPCRYPCFEVMVGLA
jgi:hypothetical protein